MISLILCKKDSRKEPYPLISIGWDVNISKFTKSMLEK